MNDNNRPEVVDDEQITMDDSINEGPQAPQVNRVGKIRRRTDITRSLNIPTLQQLDILEPDQIVVSIPDLENPGEEWDIIVQELSPGQQALLSNTGFMKNAVSARQKLDTLDIDTEDESPENLEKIQGIMTELQNQGALSDFDEYKIEVCLLGIVAPEGITREMIRKWSSNSIDLLYDAINGGATAATAVDAFPGKN